MATRGLDSQIVGVSRVFLYYCIDSPWGKIEGRHISIIAVFGYHVDYMNRKGWFVCLI